MRKLTVILSLLVALSMLLAACGTATPVAEVPAEEAPVAEAPVEEAPVEEAPVATGKTQVRWFVGLGAGSDEGTFAPQQAVVDEFNASQDAIELVLEIVDNDAAYDTLATQIAAGNAPDIVGPVGIRGRDSFKGAWLDLQPMLDKNNYDLSDFDQALVEFYQVKEEGQLGVPFAIFPSFIIYNADLFDEAGLPYPPAEYGQPYVDENGVEKEWNMDTLREVAMKLSVDANGKDANSPDFDAENIVQFGFMNQWTDPRGIGTFFGSGSLVADDGVTAQIPENWKAAWEWTYKGWWEDYFIPNGPYGGADFLQGPGGPFSSGNLAMIHMHMWYVAPWAFGDTTFNWQLAATPSYNGVVTSKMHADTFGILKGSKNPDAAFEVLTYMLSPEVAPKLLNIYGGMPARLSLQGDYFEKYGETNFPGKEINWDVVVDSMAYADNPNHESYMPSFQETTDKYNEYWNLLANTSSADFEAETAKLIVDLQAIFDAAK
ncbi:MAG TPA: sugar ABC transporter substrate-binding protein [Anaerolineae bacterium]|jgi:multiple sugar transport system substrate-binding protein|nr:sugar ABC transporter substrate-binding protein [Anaerolineae bacterium]